MPIKSRFHFHNKWYTISILPKDIQKFIFPNNNLRPRPYGGATFFVYLLVMNVSANYLKKRSRNTYITALLSIAVVLFLVGLFSAVVLFGRSFAHKTETSLIMKVFLNDRADSIQQTEFINFLVEEPYVADVKLVSKEQAYEALKRNTGGEDALEILGGINPFLSSVNLQLQSGYLLTDSLTQIKARLEQNPLVMEVDVPIEMIQVVRKNMNSLTVLFSIIGILLLAFTFYLVFSTIRLSIYAQRLSIRSMQLVGATRAFIRKPFVLNGVVQGIIAGMLAVGMLVGFYQLTDQWLSQLNLSSDIAVGEEFIGLLAGIVLLGLALGLLGSYLAVNRYLNKNLDELM